MGAGMKERGTPQGGVASPLLSVIYMNRFLKHDDGFAPNGRGARHWIRVGKPDAGNLHVRLRKDKSWVLPKGKLKPGEDALAGARREVMEETGYDVSIEGFLGSMSHAEGQTEGRAVLADAGGRRAGPQADGRCDGGEMVAVAAGGRHSHAPARKGISRKRGSGGAAGRRTVSARGRRRACGTAGSR
jgi:ADP-ribose pyrophosphatase YjhB (NUDIX family)